MGFHLRFSLALGIWLLGLIAAAAPVVTPFETAQAVAEPTTIDQIIAKALGAHSIEPARLCSDEVFVRRVFVDVIGTLPTPEEARAFLDDIHADKRARLIDALLARPEFNDYWSLKWCDLLRVKSEFPINLWPNAVQAFHRWVHDAMRTNMPMDRFAREMLTASGSNFRVPPVNFYRAIQGRQPSAIAAAAALTFMGTRVEHWNADERRRFEVFFSRIAWKGTMEWKEEIVHLDPAPAETMHATLPDGTKVMILPGDDPRIAFADWLLAPGNPWFARNIANRAWSWLLGRGIVHEPDDLGPHNPPANPELLAHLERELTRSGYDLRHLFRVILNSQAYQRSSIPRSDHPEAAAQFAHYMVRRLDAEVLIDALCQLFGTAEGYTSQIPEPFTFIPENQRTIALADGSITSQFLEMFGRPVRESGLESERNNQPSDEQRLHLLNSSHVQRKIERGGELSRLVTAARGNRERVVRAVYLLVLSRDPTAAELATALKYLNRKGLSVKQGADDLAWALVNSKEFLYRH